MRRRGALPPSPSAESVVAPPRHAPHDRGYTFEVVERAPRVGGTWFDNRYPGIACDIYSHLYSFSYAPNPGWSRSFSEGAEIQSYMEGVAAQYGIAPHLRLGTELVSAEWDEERRQWRVATRPAADAAAAVTTKYWDVFVPAVGLFPKARFPEVPGLESFGGEVIHSRQWDPAFDAAGKTVAVVGTGASAVQLVPRLAARAGRLLVFQRTPGWIIPKQDYLHPWWLRALFRAVPPLLWAHRAYFWLSIELFTTAVLVPPLQPDGRPCAANRGTQAALKWFLRWQIGRCGGGADLVADVTPRGGFGNKRPALSSEYWPALCLPNTRLVPHGVTGLEPGAVLAGGEAHAVDAVVFATGFDMLPHPSSKLVKGRGGRSLADAYAPESGHWMGMASPDFPNMFQLFGPGSLGHNNLVTQIEVQGDHVLRVLREMGRRRARVAAVRPAAQRAYLDARAARLRDTVMHTARASWYLTSARDLWTHHAGNQVEYWRRLRASLAATYSFE